MTDPSPGSQPGLLRMDPLASIEDELRCLARDGLLRHMRELAGATAEVLICGRTIVNFSSNNYLGFADHPAVVAAIVAAAASEGFGSGGSRLIAGNAGRHRSLERALEQWLGVERALLFGSGYQANVGLLGALARPGDTIFSDSLNHASLIDGCRLSRAGVEVYPHLDVGSLSELVRRSTAPRKLIVTESVFSMDGDCADLAALATLARETGSILVVDDAHSVGVLGSRGSGLASGIAHVVMGAFGKAFGGFGAFVAGRSALVELVAQRARSFVFSTAAPALVSAGNEAALGLLAGVEGNTRRAALQDRIEQLTRGLSVLGLAGKSRSHIQPILVRNPDPLAAMRVSDLLMEQGLFVQGIRPPTVPRGTSRIRISLMATHSAAHVDQLIEALGGLRSELSG